MRKQISNLEITKAFSHTNFTIGESKKLLALGVLKIAAGYADSHTVTTAMWELKFAGPSGPTKKGFRFSLDYFNSNHQ